MKSIKNIYKTRLFCTIAAVGMIAAAGSGTEEATALRPFGADDDIGAEKGIISQWHYGESFQGAGELMKTGEKESQPQPVSSSMGSVPYFKDDAGKRTQAVDGCLYAYWNNRLCRYDQDTLEETVLYEAPSSQNGEFCIWGEYVYFMVVPNVNTVGRIHGYLYRVKGDGSEEAVCLTSVRIPNQWYEYDYYSSFILDTYEDVLYLIGQWDDAENLYFRLNQDGSLSRIAESETLYGQLPEGYSCSRHYKQFITLPYAMRNYGYVFVEDEDDNLVRMDLDSGELEIIDLSELSYWSVFTNDSIVVSNGDIWYRISLDNIDEKEEIGQAPSGSSFDFWDEDGLYFMKKDDDRATITLMDWEGDLTTLHKNFAWALYSEADRWQLSYSDGNYYYYIVSVYGNEEVRRLELKEDAEPEKVTDYYINPYWSVTSRERFTYDWTDQYLGNQVDYEITEVHFTEETAGFGRINAFLDDLYAEKIAAIEKYRDELKTEFDREYYENRGPESVGFTDTANVSFFDENYVGICMDWFEYGGETRDTYGSVYYMFDRNTGERLYITDMVNNSSQEICEIIAPYIEVLFFQGTDEEGWEADILKEGRFFLSEEGIGIHFVYEIGVVERDIIVPYSAFDMKRD